MTFACPTCLLTVGRCRRSFAVKSRYATRETPPVDELIPLIVGFLLTTVLGGVLGTFLQQRAWKHQNEARLSEEEFRRADAIAEAISQLLDKRLYRMLRLFYALRRLSRDEGSLEIVEQRLGDYNAVLYEWNDRINLNLALIGTYFGESARAWLDDNIYETFQRVGSAIEDQYRAAIRHEQIEIPDALETELLALNDQLYRLGVFTSTQLRAGCVGRRAPDPIGRVDSPSDVTGTGVTLVDIRRATKGA